MNCQEREMKDVAKTNPLVIVEGLKKSFKDLCVLDEMTFRLGEGEILGIIGPSGSGKTTLLRCLDLLETFEDGVITFGGPFGVRVWPGAELEVINNCDSVNRISAPQPSVVRRKIGFVFQSFNLWEDRSVLQNLTLAPIVVQGLTDGEAETRAEELLSRFGLKDKLLSKVWRLSGGQRQRVAIVRALMMEPALLLCDEVTSALDPVLAYEVLEMIRSLRDEGLTMIVVTHHIEFVATLCDRVVYLNNGKFMQIDTPERLLKEPASQEIATFLKILRFAG